MIVGWAVVNEKRTHYLRSGWVSVRPRWLPMRETITGVGATPEAVRPVTYSDRIQAEEAARAVKGIVVPVRLCP